MNSNFKLIAICVVLLIILSQPLKANANYETGKAAFDKCDYATAMTEWYYASQNNPEIKNEFEKAYKLFSEKTDAISQFNLGVTLSKIGRNEEALQYFEKSANQGFIPAQKIMRKFAFSNNNLKDGLKWLSIMANNGDSESLIILSNCYKNGSDGFEKDWVKAYMWKYIAENTGMIEEDRMYANYQDIRKDLTPKQIQNAESDGNVWLQNFRNSEKRDAWIESILTGDGKVSIGWKKTDINDPAIVKIKNYDRNTGEFSGIIKWDDYEEQINGNYSRNIIQFKGDGNLKSNTGEKFKYVFEVGDTKKIIEGKRRSSKYVFDKTLFLFLLKA